MAEAISDILSHMARKLSRQRDQGQVREESSERKVSSPINIVSLNNQDKVRKWLSSSDSGIFISSEPDFLQEIALSSSSDEGEIFDDRGRLPDSLKAIADDIKYVVELVTWDASQCDMFVQLGDRLLPIHKQTVVSKSDYFHEVLKESEDAKVILIEDHESCSVRSALRYIYSSYYDISENCHPLRWKLKSKDLLINDNVPDLLHLGQEFKIKDLSKACIDHLRRSTSFKPMIILTLARRYNLKNLYDFACRALSKITNFEKTAEFLTLDQSTQILIMEYTIERYQRAWSSLEQFDVHLCSYHGDCPTNNDCCYRSATYKQHDGRTFLVRMETPAKKLTDAFKAAFER